MSAFDVLAQAVKALAPAGTVLGQVDATAPLPWRSLRVSAPGVSQRSDASPPQAFVVRVSLLISTGTDAGTLRLAGEAHDALEGARPVAVGWHTGPLLSRGTSQPYESDATVTSSNRRVVTIALSYEFTASRIPEV